MSPLPSKMDSATVEKCLNFCNGLVKSNKQFSFKLSMGKEVSLNFENKEPVNSSWNKKKKSPSQLRRENKRRMERKQAEDTEIVTEEANIHFFNEVSEEEETGGFKCRECAQTFKSEKGLKIHFGKTHKSEVLLPTPEKERCFSSLEEPSLTLTPPHGPRNDENKTVTKEESEQPIPLLKEAENLDLEVTCLKQISEYKELVKYLARVRYIEFECECSACDPKHWERLKKKKT